MIWCFTEFQESFRWGSPCNPQSELAPFLDTSVETIGAYLKRMTKGGVYGDDLMLRALSGKYGVKFKILKKMENGNIQWFEVGDGEWNRLTRT